MKVLVLATQKGGSGKSTLATSLAAAAAQDGVSVLLIDLDPQGSITAWAKRRGNVDAPSTGVRVVSAQPADLRRILAEAPDTLAIVDTPGLLGSSVAMAVQPADLVLMPVKPSITDIDALLPSVEALRRLGRPFAAVLSQCSPASPARTVEAATALAELCPIAPAMIASRADYLDAAMLGQGVTEFNPSGKASAEIKLLWTWAKREMGNDKAATDGHGARGHIGAVAQRRNATASKRRTIKAG